MGSMIFRGIRHLAFNFGFGIGFIYYFCVGIKEGLTKKDC